MASDLMAMASKPTSDFLQPNSEEHLETIKRRPLRSLSVEKATSRKRSNIPCNNMNLTSYHTTGLQSDLLRSQNEVT